MEIKNRGFMNKTHYGCLCLILWILLVFLTATGCDKNERQTVSRTPSQNVVRTAISQEVKPPITAQPEPQPEHQEEAQPKPAEAPPPPLNRRVIMLEFINMNYRDRVPFLLTDLSREHLGILISIPNLVDVYYQIIGLKIALIERNCPMRETVKEAIMFENTNARVKYLNATYNAGDLTVKDLEQLKLMPKREQKLNECIAQNMQLLLRSGNSS
jgi:hypothetical protein